MALCIMFLALHAKRLPAAFAQIAFTCQLGANSHHCAGDAGCDFDLCVCHDFSA